MLHCNYKFQADKWDREPQQKKNNKQSEFYCESATKINKKINEGVNKVTRGKFKKNEPKPEPTTKKCPFCCSEIDIKATRCPHCTSELDN